MDLQESHLRGTKVNSEDPLHISIRSNDSLPSFVAAPGIVEAAAELHRGANIDEIRDFEAGGTGSDEVSHGTAESLAIMEVSRCVSWSDRNRHALRFTMAYLCFLSLYLADN